LWSTHRDGLSMLWRRRKDRLAGSRRDNARTLALTGMCGGRDLRMAVIARKVQDRIVARRPPAQPDAKVNGMVTCHSPRVPHAHG
jgi:hypothetical protein